MVVPADLRAMVGKTAWTESLGTTDPLLAAEKRGMLIARHKALIRELRASNGRRAEVEALGLLDRAFTGLAVARGSMDAAVGQQLNLLATFVCDSWAGGEEAGQPQWWGDIPVHEPATIIDVVPSIDAERERDVFRLRAEILEGRGIADGLVYQELATILLRRRIFRPIWFVVSYMRSIEPRLNLEPDNVYDAVAEAYLRKLAEHRFDCWPSNIHAAMIPFAQTNAPQPITLPSLPAKAAAPTPGRHNGLLAMPLTEACRYWQEQRRPGASAITEAKRAVARFVALFGDVVVGDITRDQVIEFRNLVSDIPPQTELARVVASGRTLRSVIDAARKARREWEAGDRNQPAPDRLAPGSVKKDVGAISSILGKIQSDLGQGVNVAADIEIAGYSKTRKGQKRPRLPFTSAMMQTLFDSPLFTGCAGKGDAARAKPGPHVYQDELYWCLLFGVVGGPRLGEIGQIALKDIHECDLRRTYGEEFDGRCTYRAVGFDHFAQAHDPLARAAANGTLHRNFQGFTDDPADIVIGLGASAISAFPDRLLQNAKSAGAWHQAIGAGRFATTRGIHRSPLDQRRGQAIAALLCHGVANLDGLPERGAIRGRLHRFEQVGLVAWDGARLRLAADALPYARSIAAAFDAWRNEEDMRFSHAV